MAVHHRVFARLYPVVGKAMERGGMDQRRQELLTGLSGEVVEVGAGDGLNFPHYPPAVTRVLAVEPEPHLRRLAREAASHAPVPVEVVDGLAERLPCTDGSADAVVVSLVLCSVADQTAALREIRRVLKPGGRLRFLEHVRADTPGLVRLQLVLDATLWPRVAGGCHTGRDTAAAIARAGFTVKSLDRYLFPGARTPVSFHILGTAIRGG
ncbi:SAM-dependent methyltransferase [Arthrobacter sp. PGP41]|uniref:class I SAM-dependent methyltransferase n=1 Tax=Arthrobacter sp. PGP41 TaxID=2079227 RepID=UPI000CDC30B5|nr:class I SAM-dependent methyltransferase [Arthrobacter sp. PGP41]AUZ33897.1 SAM-dependent methyltransferase [Arthrobacter sp. PGP41]